MRGKSVTIKEDGTVVNFDRSSGKEYARSNDTRKMSRRVQVSKFNASAKYEEIIENATNPSEVERFTMTINERIRQRRLELGFTQEELAHKIGYKSKVAICKIESGQRHVRQDMIENLAIALDTTPSYLMGWDKADDDSTLAMRLLCRYRSLDDLEQAMIRKIMSCDEQFNRM